MSFNLLPKFLTVVTGPGERQINEPGANAVDNCGPACGSILMQVLGYPDIEPQDWINQMPGYGPNYHGGTALQSLNGFIAAHYPNPPSMEVVQPRDGVAQIDAWGSAGLLSIGQFFCDSQARLLDHWSAISHYCLILAYDGASVTHWNPWWGVETLPVAFWRGAALNIFDVCHRSITGAPGATAGSEILGGDMDVTDPNFQALIARVYTLIENLDAVPDLGPQVPRGVVGEKNALKADLEGIKAELAALKVQPASTAAVDLAPVLAAIKALTLKAQ
jgi:hypothetical protein